MVATIYNWWRQAVRLCSGFGLTKGRDPEMDDIRFGFQHAPGVSLGIFFKAVSLFRRSKIF